MPTTLVHPLPALAPVRNPLRAVFADSAAPASGRDGISEAEVRLQIEDVPGSGQYRTIGEYLNPYDYGEDTASVYLQRALLGMLKFGQPETSSGLTLHPMEHIVKRYRVQARDVVDGEPQGEFNTQGPYHAWMAGTSFVNNQMDIVGNNAVIWLTTRPYNRRYYPGEFLPLCFLPTASGTLTLNVTKHPISGEPQIIEESLGAVTAFQPVQLNLQVDTTGLKSFDINLSGISGGYYTLKFAILPEPQYFTQLIYGNSLGGFDVLVMTGKQSHHHETSGEIIETALDPDHDGQGGNYRPFNQKAVDSLTLRTGYMHLEDRRVLRDMALVNEIYLYRNNTIRKLILENAAQLISTDGEFLHSSEFTARYAFDNYAYNNTTL